MTNLLSHRRPRDKNLSTHFTSNTVIQVLSGYFVFCSTMRAMNVYWLSLLPLVFRFRLVGSRYDNSLSAVWALCDLTGIGLICLNTLFTLRTFEFKVHCHTYLHPMPPPEKFRVREWGVSVIPIHSSKALAQADTMHGADTPREGNNYPVPFVSQDSASILDETAYPPLRSAGFLPRLPAEVWLFAAARPFTTACIIPKPPPGVWHKSHLCKKWGIYRLRRIWKVSASQLPAFQSENVEGGLATSWRVMDMASVGCKRL